MNGWDGEEKEVCCAVSGGASGVVVVLGPAEYGEKAVESPATPCKTALSTNERPASSRELCASRKPPFTLHFKSFLKY